jgi:antitoxin (DNA-binding transcriptional repressor) of toxin-antitoxin stability system
MTEKSVNGPRPERLTVTKRGRVIARMAPTSNEQQAAGALLKKLRKRARVGDVISPIDDQAWDAERADP